MACNYCSFLGFVVASLVIFDTVRCQAGTAAAKAASPHQPKRGVGYSFSRTSYSQQGYSFPEGTGFQTNQAGGGGMMPAAGATNFQMAPAQGSQGSNFFQMNNVPNAPAPPSFLQMGGRQGAAPFYKLGGGNQAGAPPGFMPVAMNGQQAPGGFQQAGAPVFQLGGQGGGVGPGFVKMGGQNPNFIGQPSNFQLPEQTGPQPVPGSLTYVAQPAGKNYGGAMFVVDPEQQRPMQQPQQPVFQQQMGMQQYPPGMAMQPAQMPQPGAMMQQPGGMMQQPGGMMQQPGGMMQAPGGMFRFQQPGMAGRGQQIARQPEQQQGTFYVPPQVAQTLTQSLSNPNSAQQAQVLNTKMINGQQEITVNLPQETDTASKPELIGGQGGKRLAKCGDNLFETASEAEAEAVVCCGNRAFNGAYLMCINNRILARPTEAPPPTTTTTSTTTTTTTTTTAQPPPPPPRPTIAPRMIVALQKTTTPPMDETAAAEYAAAGAPMSAEPGRFNRFQIQSNPTSTKTIQGDFDNLAAGNYGSLNNADLTAIEQAHTERDNQFEGYGDKKGTFYLRCGTETWRTKESPVYLACCGPTLTDVRYLECNQNIEVPTLVRFFEEGSINIDAELVASDANLVLPTFATTEAPIIEITTRLTTTTTTSTTTTTPAPAPSDSAGGLEEQGFEYITFEPAEPSDSSRPRLPKSASNSNNRNPVSEVFQDFASRVEAEMASKRRV